MTLDDLTPIVYDRWPNARLNTSKWPENHSLPDPSSWRNKTSVDDIFGWGERYGRTRRPIFAKVPTRYNTLFNATPGAFMDSAYILGTPPQGNPMLCSIRSFLTPNCSTEYRTSIIGGSLTSRCKNGNDELSYPELTGKNSNVRFETGWIDLVSGWGTAIGFGGGIKDVNGSNSRLLTQLIPTEPRLNSALPSIAEALAIQVGGSLLLGSIDAPFLLSTKFNATLYDPTLSQTGLRESFSASIRTQDYGSGGTQNWQKIFYAVLAAVFMINSYCLFWFFSHRSFVTDFIEPQNLFSITMNSPPSVKLDGACGGGPTGEQMSTRWFIKVNPRQEHFYFEEGPEGCQPRESRKNGLRMHVSRGEALSAYQRLASVRSSII